MLKSITQSIIFIGFEIFLFSASTYAVTPNDFRAENERIFEVILSDGTVIEQGMISYAWQGTYYVPFVDLARSLSLEFEVSADGKSANGFIISENRVFSLDVIKCQSLLIGAATSFPCELAVPFLGDIYVPIYSVQNWLPIEFEVDPFKSQIILKTTEKLPIQLKRDRELQAKRLQEISGDYDPGYPKQTDQNSKSSGPVLDQRLAFGAAKSGSQTLTTSAFDSTVTGEIYGLNGLGHFSGNETQLDSIRFTLSKSDELGRIGGILRATSIEALDVNMPVSSLITYGRQKRGIVVSNAPLQEPSTFSSHDFYGNLQSGWEVELYQNEVFISRFDSNQSGRYEFKNIPLFYGRNQFRLSFYGPTGQRKDEYVSFEINPQMLKPGRFIYKLGLASDQGAPVIGLLLKKSIFDFLTLSASYYRLKIYDELFSQRQYYSFGVHSFIGPVFLEGVTARDLQGGAAYEASTRLPFRSLVLGSKYSVFNQFQSDSINTRTRPFLTKQYTGDLQFSVPILPALTNQIEYQSKEFENLTRTGLIRDRIAMSVNSFYLAQTSEYRFETFPAFNYLTDLILTQINPRIHISLDYNSKQLNLTEIESQLKLNDTASSRQKLRYYYDLKTLGAALSVQKNFSQLTAGIELGSDFQRSHTLGVYLFSSLAYDSNSKKLEISGESQALQGAASVIVFWDKNGNGQPDPDEPRLKDILIALNSRELSNLTDSEGRLFISRLTPYQANDISLPPQFYSDPFLKPTNKGIRIFPRPGKINEIFFPLIKAGEIDGVVEVNLNGVTKARRGVSVRLIDTQGPFEQSQKTDSDGVFLFGEIKPGSYRLEISDEYLKNNHLQSAPLLRSIAIPIDGSIVTGQNFKLSRTR